MNDAEIKRARLPAIGIDHGHAGIAQRSIDRKNAHESMCDQPLNEKDDANQSKDKTDKPKRTPFG